MGQFLTPLKTEQLGKWQHILLAPLVYKDDDGTFYTVPESFQTDFASVDALHNIFLFPIYALVAGYGNLAGTLHDYLYSQGKLSRKQCDDILYRALRAEGVAKWRAWLFWAGVRVGGASHFTTAPI